MTVFVWEGVQTCPPLYKHLEKLVTLQSHILVSFQQITLTLGNLANFKALSLADFH